jgi:diguanylate cyclase (GGDEF)-like protein/hemerythrin-like metal-binding protein
LEISTIEKKADIAQFEVFPWNRNLETGHAAIDRQHQALVRLLNDLANTLINDEPIVINQAFNALAAYANQHFEMEEAIWTESFDNDAWLNNHRRSHASFLPQINKIKKQDARTPLAEVVEQIIKFLIRWLAFHIIDSDKRMAIVVEGISSGLPLSEAKAVADEKMSGSMRVLIDTILNMYDDLSSKTLDLMRERKARIEAEEKLRQANKKLEELAVTDQLTGLYNRRFFNKVFREEILKAKRGGHPLTYMVIDIDFFKHYNDQYGHLAGDDVLKKVGKCLADVCRRSSDLAFRLGGEEFGILAFGLDNQQAIRFAEIIRISVADLTLCINHSPSNIQVTISVGLVCKVPALGDTLEDYFSIADNRLYMAKAGGRNRVQASDIDSQLG